MIVLTGNNEEVSFTDQGSPDTRITGDEVCINAQVKRDLSLQNRGTGKPGTERTFPPFPNMGGWLG